MSGRTWNVGSGALCAMFLGATVLMATPVAQQQADMPAAPQTLIAGQPTFRGRRGSRDDPRHRA